MRDPEQDDPPEPEAMTAEEFVTGLDPYDDPPEPDLEDPPEPEPEGLLEKLKDVGRHVFGLNYEGDS